MVVKYLRTDVEDVTVDFGGYEEVVIGIANPMKAIQKVRESWDKPTFGTEVWEVNGIIYEVSPDGIIREGEQDEY